MLAQLDGRLLDELLGAFFTRWEKEYYLVGLKPRQVLRDIP
jgi:hypothetical protein